MNYNENDIQTLAEEVKDIYVRYRQLSFPAYKPNPRHNACWNNLARILIDRNIDPEQYIKYQFESCIGGYPWPNMLYSANLLGKFICQNDSVEHEIRLRIQLELDNFKLAYERNNNNVMKALCDATEDFSDVFKFCIARKFGANEMPSRWLVNARAYLLTHKTAIRFYEKIWNKLVAELEKCS